MINNQKNMLKGKLLASTASAAAALVLSLGAGAYAQDQDADAEFEEVVVTGSRIPRKDLVANSPVNVVQAEEFRLAATVETESLLNTLPQVVPSFGATTNNPGTGTATVDLRNLGTNRTLVLVNSRRMVGSAVTGVVDINNIPASLIERVEVVTGGASAVYGSDAMAGVVNFIMKRDFEGAQVSSQYGITQEGDAQRFNTDFTLGTNFADGKGNVVIHGNYFWRQQTQASERDFAATQLSETTDADGNPIFVPGGSATIPQGRFNSNNLDDFGVLDSFGNPIDSNGILVTDDGQAKAVVFPQDEYNFAPLNNLQLPLERWTVNAMGRYEVTENINMFAEMMFASNTINRTLAPTPFSESGFQVDLRNPNIPTAVRDVLAQIDDDGDNIISTGVRKRMEEAGNRVSTDNRNTWRFVAGFDGELGNGMNWEVFYNFGRQENANRQDGNIVISKFQQGLLVDPDNPTQCLDTSGGCVVLNPFGQGAFTEEMANFVLASATNLTSVQQQQAGANIAGDVVDLPAGPLGMALGVEYRKESANFQPDTFLASGDIDGFNAGLPTSGSYDVKEIFAETVIPILADMPGAEYFGLEAGVRFSDYSSAGGVTSYKIGGEWRPITDLKVRGSFQRAVRAPNIQELFRGQTNSFPGATDFCNASSNRTQAEADFCVNVLGVPAADIATFNQENAQIEVLLGGNPNLSEETSDTFTVGFVLTPEAVPGLTFTADYYSIKIADAINTFGGGLQSTITACQNTLDAQSEFCQVLTARRDDGQLEEVPLFNQNIAFQHTKGIDFRVDYGFDTDFGTFDWFLAGTHVLQNEIQSSPVVATVECAGTVGVRGTCGNADPKWRFVSRLTHRMDDFTTSIRYRYVGKVTDERINLAEANGATLPNLLVPEIGAEHYVDLGFNYQLNDTFNLFANMDNILNNKPPVFGRGAAGQFNTDASAYDVLGRRFTIGFRASF